MKVVQQISTDKIIHRESPDFAPGMGIQNARFLHPEIPKADMQEVEVEWEDSQYQDALKAQTSYVELRRREYPSFHDYVDGIVKGDTAQVQKYINDCLAVKAKYPKVV